MRQDRFEWANAVLRDHRKPFEVTHTSQLRDGRIFAAIIECFSGSPCHCTPPFLSLYVRFYRSNQSVSDLFPAVFAVAKGERLHVFIRATGGHSHRNGDRFSCMYSRENVLRTETSPITRSRVRCSSCTRSISASRVASVEGGGGGGGGALPVISLSSTV